MPLSLLLLVSCTVVRFGAPEVENAPGGVVPVAEASGVSTAGLVLRIEALLATTEDVDRRDRLVELLDLATASSKLDASARRRVATYVERVILVEERTSPVAIAESPMQVAESVVIVTEEPLGVESPETPPAPDLLAPIREMQAAGAYLDVVAAVESDASLAALPAAVALRSDALNAWAGAEREASAAEFLVARALPSSERIPRLQAVAARLTAVNARFPDNRFADEIRRHIELVNAELAK